MGELQVIILKKPYLAWDIPQNCSLSDKSSFEHILNFGNWDDFQKSIQIIGLTNLHNLFKRIISSKKPNLRPQTINYFTLYFDKYCPLKDK